MKIWYKTSSHQMDDPEMEYLQSVDCASCAVWAWIKRQCKQRDSDRIPSMRKIELKIVVRRLGIDTDRLDLIVKVLEHNGWVGIGDAFFVQVARWETWQTSYPSPMSDAKRKIQRSCK